MGNHGHISEEELQMALDSAESLGLSIRGLFREGLSQAIRKGGPVFRVLMEHK